MKPYYADDLVTLYHGDCRDVLPHIEQPDAMLTDPPWGVHKAAWDADFVLPSVPISVRALGLMPGVWNIPACPVTFGALRYRWTLSAHLTNGMTNGAVGFGNWIPCLLYSDDETSLYVQDGDCKRFVVGREPKPDHPSPKPLNVTGWFLSRIPGLLICDPFAGSGTILRAAKDFGRRAVGIEQEERHCASIAQRLSQNVLELGGAA